MAVRDTLQEVGSEEESFTGHLAEGRQPDPEGGAGSRPEVQRQAAQREEDQESHFPLPAEDTRRTWSVNSSSISSILSCGLTSLQSLLMISHLDLCLRTRQSTEPNCPTIISLRHCERPKSCGISSVIGSIPNLTMRIHPPSKQVARPMTEHHQQDRLCSE